MQIISDIFPIVKGSYSIFRSNIMQNKPFQVKWGLNTERQWASLFNSDFSELSISGVYIIWGYNIHNSHVIIKVVST